MKAAVARIRNVDTNAATWKSGQRQKYQAKRKARELASKTAINASPSKRMAGPGKDLLSKADSLLTLPADQLQGKFDKYLGAVGDFQLETDENDKRNRASLARLVGRYLDLLMARS